MKYLAIFKIIASFTILILTIISCIAARCIRKPRWIHRLHVLASGIFLGGGLSHLLPDANENLEQITPYPLSSAICLSTFVILTCVDFFISGEKDLDVSSSLQTSLLAHEYTKMKMSTLTLYIIMCIHSAITGMALGILRNWSTVIAIFCAIVGHKPVEAFATALFLLHDGPARNLFYLMIIAYSILTPLSLIFGMFVGEVVSNLAYGIINSFSAGTFVFVGAVEWMEMMGERDKLSLKDKFITYLMFVLGVVWMLLIAIIEALSGD